MNAKIITYTIAHKPPHIRSKLNRELNGYKDTSHGGTYTYKRKGLLNCILHKKPAKNTIIAATEPAKMIIELLNKFEAKINIINIKIDLTELKK